LLQVVAVVADAAVEPEAVMARLWRATTRHAMWSPG